MEKVLQQKHLNLLIHTTQFNSTVFDLIQFNRHSQPHPGKLSGDILLAWYFNGSDWVQQKYTPGTVL